MFLLRCRLPRISKVPTKGYKIFRIGDAQPSFLLITQGNKYFSHLSFINFSTKKI